MTSAAIIHCEQQVVPASEYAKLERRYQEGLEAWRKNNLHHAQRIESLEAENTALKRQLSQYHEGMQAIAMTAVTALLPDPD